MVQTRHSRPSSKDEILRVFAEGVAERGYSDTSISDVANALGLSKGTIVHHFGTKAALLVRVHEAYMERRLNEAHHILASLSSPSEQLAAMIYALLASHRDDRASTMAFLREFVRFAGDGETSTVRDRRERYTAIVNGIVRRGMEQGYFRRDDPSLVALQIFGMCNYAWTWYRPDGRKDSEEIAATFVRTVLIGLAPLQTSGLPNGLDELVAQAIHTVQQTPGRLP